MNKIINFTIVCSLLLCSCEKDNKNNENITKSEEEISKMNNNEISAKHILLDSEKEANDLYNKITKGEITFEEAAKKYSKCPSGRNEGSLGYFGKGVMVKEFEDAAFALEEGEISKPIKTQFGWHLIKVDKK